MRLVFFAKNNPDDYAKKIEEIIKDKKKYNEVCDNAFENLYIHWDDEVKNIYELYLKLKESRDK